MTRNVTAHSMSPGRVPSWKYLCPNSVGQAYFEALFQPCCIAVLFLPDAQDVLCVLSIARGCSGDLLRCKAELESKDALDPLCVRVLLLRS